MKLQTLTCVGGFYGPGVVPIVTDRSLGGGPVRVHVYL